MWSVKKDMFGLLMYEIIAWIYFDTSFCVSNTLLYIYNHIIWNFDVQ